MLRLGIDIGASTLKCIVVNGTHIQQKYMLRHHGRILTAMEKAFSKLALPDEVILVAITGSNSQSLIRHISDFPSLGEIPAIVEGVRFTVPNAGSIIDIGAQGARFITDIKKAVPLFSINEHCAGGTGSFFEDQMSRLGMKIEDYSAIVAQAKSVPRLSGRCAVFAKTDIIHRQQEGVSTPDILLGLCHAMIRNYKATIVKNLPIEKPVVFTGGVTQNNGAVQAIYEIFSLDSQELIIPQNPLYMASLGAALKAEKTMKVGELYTLFDNAYAAAKTDSTLRPLSLIKNAYYTDPVATGSIPQKGCSLGIDIGSTSTDLVVIDTAGKLIDFQYLRTAGSPETAVRTGLASIKERFGEISFNSVGVTGSGRERIGRMIGADAIRDEISAQAKGACFWTPDADTVFEIGGQDSKYIFIKDGEVQDFMMNKICAAGTGSFIEEQAGRMDIPLADFGRLALSSTAPAELGERCTVFIETAIDTAAGNGASMADIAAGLCHSVVRNYVTKVVGEHKVGNHIVLQGGVAYNPGIVAAFKLAFGDRLTVSPCFSISGAFGAALLAQEVTKGKTSNFKGYDFPSQYDATQTVSDVVKTNSSFYEQSAKLLMKDYVKERDPQKKTVGIPYALMMHKFFPMANAFFKTLGFNVLLTQATNEETIRRSQQYAQGETCYPVKLMYGHFVELLEAGVDYIFMPNVHTVKHEKSQVKHNYGCVYMQNAAKVIAQILKLKEKGITLLNPTFDLDMGKTAMAQAMVGVGKQLGYPIPKCTQAMMCGGMAVMQQQKAVEKLGKELLAQIKPDEKVLVLITRNYGMADPVLNMGIPKLLLERGHKVITLEHLPAHDVDLSDDYPNLYWPFGQHIISGAKLVAHHPNLYAVYLTNHGCGPDTMLSYLFKEEMGDKPYLQIEVDEHFSQVGVITRIEAFLNSLSHRPAVCVPVDFKLEAVTHRTVALSHTPDTSKKMYIPECGLYSYYIASFYEKVYGVKTEIAAPIDRKTILNGRGMTTTKEYLPFVALLGVSSGIFASLNNVQLLIPQTEGAEADGMYARSLYSILTREYHSNNTIVSPKLESLPQESADIDLLFRAVLAADLLYAASSQARDLQKQRWHTVPSFAELKSFAQKLGSYKRDTVLLAAVGTPLTQTNLNDGVLDTLENEKYTIIRAPLTEYLLFLWAEDEANSALCTELEEKLHAISSLMGINSPFAQSLDALKSIADKNFSQVHGANLRYRFAKAIQMGQRADAVLLLCPRYENAAMLMEMAGIHDICEAPLNLVYIDGDWDEGAWSRLRSFLYYCKKKSINK
ncbi:MAG: acyl-CoA dehydratase activase [Treponema sp.]|nr:acyl-CoA dehydratase activase [Treponema sp.]